MVFFSKQHFYLASDSVLELHCEEENNNSSAFLPDFVDLLMLSYNLELFSYICSDCSQVAGSLLTPGYSSQNCKLERGKIIKLLATAVILMLTFFHRV